MIALFDSGYGGLTILDSIRKRLPQYDYLYLGDNARNPYGTRSFDVVYKYTLECTAKLFDMGADLVILACNTASAKALRNIQQNDLARISKSPEQRVLGVIRPSVEVIGQLTRSGNIGVMATQGTVTSLSYPIELAKISPEVRVFQQACPMWVPLVENNEAALDGADYFVEKYVDMLFGQCPSIDVILLACTHYPLLLPKIEKYVAGRARIVCQGDIVADSLADYLQRHTVLEQRLQKGGGARFFTTEAPEKFASTASLFWQGQLDINQVVFQ